MDFLAGMGLQRKANEEYQKTQLGLEDHRRGLERRKKEDAFLDQKRPMEMENLGLQRRATQMELQQAERRAQMQEAMRNAFSGGKGLAGIAEVAQQYGDFETYKKATDYSRKAEEEGMTEAVRWAKLGRLDEAARRYNARGADKIDGLKLVDGRLVAIVGGQDVDWGNLEDHARLLGVGNKVEWKDGQEYVNGQPTGKFAKPNPNDKDRYKVVKNADGSERLVDTHAPSASQAQRAGVSKDVRKALEEMAKNASQDPGETAPPEERQKAADARTQISGISVQIMENAQDADGMQPEIAHTVARDYYGRTPLDPNKPAGPGNLRAELKRQVIGDKLYEGIEYRHPSGNTRFYRLYNTPVGDAPRRQVAPQVPQAARDKLLANPDRVQEFDEVFGEGAGKRILDEHRASQGTAPAAKPSPQAAATKTAPQAGMQGLSDSDLYLRYEGSKLNGPEGQTERAQLEAEMQQRGLTPETAKQRYTDTRERRRSRENLLSEINRMQDERIRAGFIRSNPKMKQLFSQREIEALLAGKPVDPKAQ